jgi:hypothetical protein
MSLHVKEALICLQNNIFAPTVAEDFAPRIQKELIPQIQRFLLLGDNKKDIQRTIKRWQDYLPSFELEEAVDFMMGNKSIVLSRIKTIQENYQPGILPYTLDVLLGRDANNS